MAQHYAVPGSGIRRNDGLLILYDQTNHFMRETYALHFYRPSISQNKPTIIGLTASSYLLRYAIAYLAEINRC